MSDLTNRQMGSYKLVKKLGEGGMAEVYLAQNRAEGEAENVAIKFIKQSILRNAEAMKRFLDREVEIAICLEHPNLLEIYESGLIEGRPYYTMEYLAGGTLLSRMRSSSITLPDGLKIIDQVASALIYIHQRSILHRDLKPSNILFTTRDIKSGIKLADFGLSKALGSEAITEAGRVMGTAKYLAPEIINGHEPLPESDIFSLGILSFEMLTGREPFLVDQKIGYLSANVNDTPPDPQSLNSKLPTEVCLILLKMLSRNPAERYNAGELKRDLGRVNSMLRDGPSSSILVVRDDTSSAFYIQDLKRKNLFQERPFLNPTFFLVLVIAIVIEIAAAWWMMEKTRKSSAESLVHRQESFLGSFSQNDVRELATLIYFMEKGNTSFERKARRLAGSDLFGGQQPVDEYVNKWGGKKIRKLRKRLDGLVKSEWANLCQLAEKSSPALSLDEITNWRAFLEKIRSENGKKSPGGRLWQMLPSRIRVKIDKALQTSPLPLEIKSNVLTALNRIIKTKDIFDEEYFADIKIPDDGFKKKPGKKRNRRQHIFNRRLLENAFPAEIKKIPERSLEKYLRLTREFIASETVLKLINYDTYWISKAREQVRRHRRPQLSPPAEKQNPEAPGNQD